MKPNLFHFATGELSQDAFVCWLLSWSDPKCDSIDHSLHLVGLEFLGKLLQKCSVSVPEPIACVKVQRQYKNIDVLAVVNDSIVVLIEDKTGTQHHSGQLERYQKIIETDFPAHTIAAIYFKTGDQCSYDDIRQAGYACFLRNDFLGVLARGRERNVQNAIFTDFHQYLDHIEERVTDYQRLPVLEWHWDCWKGFFTELRACLGCGKWDYVANQSGGFMGFWWHQREGKYLQLENDKLCFKIEVDDKSLQTAAWENWHRILKTESVPASFPILRPNRRRNGRWMTVAMSNGDYRQQDKFGMLDMTKTVEFLRSAEAFLDHAASVETRSEMVKGDDP